MPKTSGISERRQRLFWHYINTLAYSLVSSIDAYRVSDTSLQFVSEVSGALIQPEQVKSFVWVHRRDRTLYTVLQLTTGLYVYTKLRIGFSTFPSGVLYTAMQLDHLERVMSKPTRERYLRRRVL
jgi:hypothetical protein